MAGPGEMPIFYNVHFISGTLSVCILHEHLHSYIKIINLDLSLKKKSNAHL